MGSDLDQKKVFCDSRDVAVKSFFVGPQAENGAWFQGLTSEVLGRWLDWRKRLFPADGRAIADHDQLQKDFHDQQTVIRDLALELSRRFEDEIPKFSPRYLGHMFSEISLPALIGHWIATLHNPNNISSESGPVGVQIEKEAISELMKMVGFSDEAPGHFTSCGTIANFEAALRARDRAIRLGLEPIFLVPENKHYSWVKAVHVLGLKAGSLWPIPLDRYGTLDPAKLKSLLSSLPSKEKYLAFVVSVLGTTELGNFDPVQEVQDLIDEARAKDGIQIWHHVDAAYGGFFLSLKNATDGLFDERALRSLNGVSRVDSVTIDPHKLGYVPYACGAFLCREIAGYQTQLFDSPYIQYQDSRDPGPFTLEGSRSASGAAATWLTLKAIGSGEDGYGRIIGRTISLRRELASLLSSTSDQIRVLPNQQSNVLCFTVGKSGGNLSASNSWVERFYSGHSGNKGRFFVSKTALTLENYQDLSRELFDGWNPQIDAEKVHLVRLTLMNPFLRSKEMNVAIMEEFCAEVKSCL